MEERAPRRFEDIDTAWDEVHDPQRFLARYLPAIRSYLRALLPTEADADDVEQQLLLGVVERGFESAEATKGKFRYYLKAAVRNAAHTHLRRQRSDTEIPHDLPASDIAWVEEYRRGVLDAAWQALEDHQRRSPENYAHDVLRLTAEEPDAVASTLARRLSARIRRPMSAVTFRKQLSRARRVFARLIVQEVKRSLTSGSPEDVWDELRELGLLPYLNGYLPGENPPSE